MLDHENAIRAIAQLASDAVRSKQYLFALEAIEAILFKTQIKESK